MKDKREFDLPSVGLVRFFNAETNESTWINTNSKKTRLNYKAKGLAFQDHLEQSFKKAGVDFATIDTSENYVKPLMNLFKRR